MRSISAFLAVLALVSACSSPPEDPEKIETRSLANPAGTELGRLVAADAARHQDKSGVVVLDTGRQGFNSRIALAGAARQTLDAQYYIWNNDTTGVLLAAQLLQAAERGVRVRLLLDDYGLGNKDAAISALAAHPFVSVRVYNPFNAGFRTGARKWGSFLLGFSRLNRRMHSKTFIADNSMAIVGGRNIGDEYFDADREMNHRDRDLLVLGPIVGAVSQQFDAMWNSQWSIPIASLVHQQPSEADIASKYSNLRKLTETPASHPYPLALSQEARSALIRAWLDEAIWAAVEFVYNPPEITGGGGRSTQVVTRRLAELLKESKTRVLVESAYFTVMDDPLVELEALLQRGLELEVLTNSLASTDVWTIHAGYTRNREKLLQLGVTLHEFRTDPLSCATLVDNESLDCSDFEYSLHAKSVVFDRKVVLVGSFNLNPRSQYLNTETALIIHSPELAQRIASDIELFMTPPNSWKLDLDESGELKWRSEFSGEVVTVDSEPQVGSWDRIKTYLLSFVPLEKYW
jgi:cardiolipin synthase C